MLPTLGVGDGVLVGVAVGGTRVFVAVAVGGTGVLVAVGVFVFVGGTGVLVGVAVGGTGVFVAVAVFVFVGVLLAVLDAVAVLFAVVVCGQVAVGDRVAADVGDRVAVLVTGIGVLVAVAVAVVLAVAGGWQVGPATVCPITPLPALIDRLVLFAALPNVSVYVIVRVRGKRVSLRLSILTPPVVSTWTLPAVAVAVTTWLLFQQPENVAFDISWPDPGLEPLTRQAKARAPAGGLGAVRV